MEKNVFKVNLNKVNGNTNFTLTKRKTDDYITNEVSLNKHVEETVINSINPILDNELNKYTSDSYDEFVFYLFNNDNSYIKYSELGFTQDDVEGRSSAFQNTKLRLNFYDDITSTRQNLIYQIDLNTQLNEYQRDGNGDVLSYTNLPLIFNIKNPNLDNAYSFNSLGYFILLPSLYEKGFVTTQLLNAKNGNVVDLISNNTNLTYSEYMRKKYITYTFLDNLYFINTNNIIYNINGRKLEIKLYRNMF